MRLLTYSPQHFEAVRTFAIRAGVPILAHRPFVDYYYAARDSCKLYLFMENDHSVIGTLGIELLRFEYCGQEIIAGVGTNYHVSRSGAGGYLFLHWMKTCPFSLEFGGSEDVHRIISQQRWKYFKGIKTYVLSSDYPVNPGNTWLHAAAKWVLRRARRRNVREYSSRIAREALTSISVREERGYTQDLLTWKSPFVFRLAPSIDYLEWRYNLALPFVRYRLFRVLTQGRTLGYVVLSDFPNRIVVAQCDGDDPWGLAYGALLSLLEVARDDQKPRTVLLNCSHVQMQPVYEQFGFRTGSKDFPFALGSLRQKIDISCDTSRWLVNFDWGDHGLVGSVPLENPGPTFS